MHLLAYDSGIGGLGVVREIRRLQPDTRITYLADNDFFPYGEKPDAILLAHILDLIGEAIEVIVPDAIIIACNTASTIALAALRETYPRTPFIGCVPPIKPAAAATRTRCIGILATAATLRRAYLANLIAQFAPDCAIHTLGTPTLADLAEQKFRGERVDIASAIAPLFTQPGGETIDSIALGCTHYTFLLPEFQALYPAITWHDPALPVARQTLAVTRGFPAEPADAPDTAHFTGAPLPVAALAPFGFAESGRFFAKKLRKNAYNFSPGQ